MVDDVTSFARCIITAELDSEALWVELRHLIDYFIREGQAECSVRFGFAWGHKPHHGESPWESIELRRLEDTVSGAERAEQGALGSDDLQLRIVGIEFLFCHDADLHLLFNEEADHVAQFHSRWKDLGHNPREWLRDKRSPGSEARGGPKTSRP